MYFGDVTRGVDFVIEDDHRAQTTCLHRCRDANGSQEVRVAIVAHVGSSAHRAGEHDGLIPRHGHIEQIGRLLQRVGAVGDDYAIHTGLRHQLGHALANGPQRIEPEVGTRQVSDLFGPQFRQSRRQGRREFLRAEEGDRPTRRSVVPHGDRATGGQNGDVEIGDWRLEIGFWQVTSSFPARSRSLLTSCSPLPIESGYRVLPDSIWNDVTVLKSSPGSQLADIRDKMTRNVLARFYGK